MNRIHKALILCVIASTGLWGCARGPGSAATADRIRALEAKIAKLEDDFRAAITVRDQLKKKLTTTEEEKSNLTTQVEQLQAVVKERDELKQLLTARTTERDSLQAQFDSFRKGIKNLLGQAELPSQSAPVTQAADTVNQGKS